MEKASAIVVAVYATLVYDIISATNSSPQTTEINAAARASTLMKWVWIGLAQAMLFAIAGIIIEAAEKRPVWPPAVGAGTAGVLLLWQYHHALRSGLESSEPGTEVYT